MIGYKVAIGIDQVDGPFLVVVKLETLSESTIITPANKIQLVTGCPILYYVGDILNEYNFPSVPDKEEIQQYRTDAAFIKEIIPIDRNYKPNNWNGLAYSIYDVSERLTQNQAYLDIPYFVYIKDKTVFSNLSIRIEDTCGKGIHFFETIEDAIYYFAYDIGSFIINEFRGIRNAWRMESRILKELVE